MNPRHWRSPFTGWLGAALVAVALLVTAVAADRPIVVLISIDGWRWDYLERYKAPTLTRLAAGGVRAEALVPSFPSKTFPNHYTIVTGLYPGHHGIIGNNIVDPGIRGRFTLQNREIQQDPRWWGGEPIWVTAERQSQFAATMFWPGSDVQIAGDRPEYWKFYEHTLANERRVDQLLQWLAEPEPWRPTFLTTYFSDVDSAGHEFGPDSAEVRKAVALVDAAMARLVAGIEKAGLSGRASIVVVSDHGMAPVSSERVIAIDDYVNPSTLDVVEWGPIFLASPRAGDPDALYRALKDKHPRMQIYTRDNLPPRYHLAGHRRLPAVIGIADDGWVITTREQTLKRPVRGGQHGYDPIHRSMHGLFIAHGPAFQQGVVVPPLANVHIYELMCRVLGLKPAPNDGDIRVTESFLR